MFGLGPDLLIVLFPGNNNEHDKTNMMHCPTKSMIFDNASLCLDHAQKKTNNGNLDIG